VSLGGKEVKPARGRGANLVQEKTRLKRLVEEGSLVTPCDMTPNRKTDVRERMLERQFPFILVPAPTGLVLKQSGIKDQGEVTRGLCLFQFSKGNLKGSPEAGTTGAG